MARILAPDERDCKPHLLPDARLLAREIPRCGTRALPLHKGLPCMDINPAKVRAALADLRISQAELSRRLLSRYTGWSEATVSRYMYGTQGDVTLTKLNELATALRVSPAALVDLEDVAQDEAERKLLRNFRTAQERDRELAQAQVEPRSPSE